MSETPAFEIPVSESSSIDNGFPPTDQLPPVEPPSAGFIVQLFLIPALIVGLMVSMFQAATQINEMTLSFIPKLIVTVLTLMIAGPWMLRVIMEFTKGLIQDVPYLIG